MHRLAKSKKQQSGMASIIVVSLLVVLLTLITLGFAKLMGRSVQNASSNETAAAASYAAQSGLNDLADYVMTNLKSGTYIKSDSCNSLIVDSTGHPGPFYNDSNVTGDNNTRYTCLLVNQRPQDLVYQNITNLKSKVVKLTTDTVTSSIDSYMFSWQSRDYPSHNTAPNSSVGLQDETTWNNNDYIPMLRVTLYPITTSGALDDSVQSNSRTFYLIPASDAPVSSKTFDFTSTADGSKKRVKCDTAQVPGFTGTSDYTCNVVINGLEKVPNIDYFYARITPIYNNVDIKIKGNDIDNRAVKFKNVQAVLDVTAKSGPSAKRLQSRVDTAGVDTTTGNVTASPNISPDDNLGPDFSLRTATALCKRYKIVNDVYDYLTIDGSCPSLNGSTVINTPPPKLSMNINGVDSQANTPPSSAYYGTDYISNGGSAQINWTSNDATSCTASGSGWSGSKTGVMSFNGNGVGVASQTFTGLTNVTNYILTCSGPGSGLSPGVSKTVTAWPPPRVSFNDTSITAGTSYSLSWNVANSTNCTAGGSWSGGKSSSVSPNTFSQSMGTWPWNDNGTKTYTLVCTDPAGRSSSAQITVGPGQPNSGTSSNATNNVNPPTCHANVNWTDNGDGSGYFTWGGSCPDVSPGSGYYLLQNCSGVDCSAIGNGGWVGAGGTSPTYGPGTYCVEYWAGADPWGWQTSTRQCKTIVAPPIVRDYVYVGGVSWYNDNGGACDDGLHDWMMCTVQLNVHQNGVPSSSISCKAYDNGTAEASGQAGVYISQLGWVQDSPPRPTSPTGSAPSETISFSCTGAYGRTYSGSITQYGGSYS
jgi:Tfp pilus assembly protein PilX